MMVKTKKKRTKQLYSEENHLNAVHAVRINVMIFRAAEEYYKVLIDIKNLSQFNIVLMVRKHVGFSELQILIISKFNLKL